MDSKKALDRRDFLKAAGAMGALFGLGARGFSAELAAVPKEAAKPAAPKKPFAKSVIQIWFWGGPSQIETWDPKPEAGYDYCGQLSSPINTNVDGLRICELMPELAKCADTYSVIRSVRHFQNAHETGSYLVQTGRMPGRYVYPCAGAVVSKFKGVDAGYKGTIPPYIVLTEPQGRFSEAGFLGSKYKPFATGGNPSSIPFEVEGIVARGITRARQESRRKLLDDLGTFKKSLASSGYLKQSELAVEQAYNLILGDAGKIFDVTTESDKVRDAYGRNKFGCSCLVARKLVESGVPYVTINYPGWDTHKSHFQEMRKLMPQTDRAVAALIADLRERGLFDSTIIWWSGEFGRTPRIQWEAPYSGGRGHWGDAFSMMLAGGGFDGGKVVGKTDDKAEKVVERPVSPCDLIGSIYSRLGIPSDAVLRTPQGDTVGLLEDNEGDMKGDGILREIGC